MILMKFLEFYQQQKFTKLKIKNILIEKKGKMNGNLDFDLDYYSEQHKNIYKNGADSIRLINWMAYFLKVYESLISFDSMESVLKILSDTS